MAAPPPKRWRLWVIGGLILLAGILAYSNSFAGVFLFDDENSITENRYIRSLWPLSRAMSAPPQATVAGRPIVCLSLAVNYALGGLNPWGYHAFNLGVHLLCGLLLFGIVRRTLGGVWHGRGLERPCSTAQDMAAPSRGHATHPLGERGSFRAVAARALARPEDVTARALARPEDVTARALARPEDVTARALARPEDVTARALAGPAANTRGRSAALLAGLIALLWVVHPLQTESVTYVVQRTESMMGLFYLLTLYCFIRGASGKRPAPWFAAAVVACALGMATKEAAVTAPVIVLLYDAVFLAGSHGSVAPPWATRIRQALRNRRLFYAALAATWTILAFIMAEAPRSGTVGFNLGTSSLDYTANQCLAIVNYIRLAFWPYPLVIDYGEPRHLSFGQVLPYAGILAILLTATVVALIRRPVLGFLGAWFFIILAPTSSFVPIISEVAAERRMYLPLAAIIVLVVIAVDALVRRLAASMAPLRAAAAVGLVAVCALGFVTHERNRAYADEIGLWRQAAAARPDNPRAYSSWGKVLVDAGKIEDGILLYRQALAILPDYTEANYNLANALQKLGRHDDAVREYSRVLQYAPYYTKAHINLGVVLAGLGRHDEAVSHYQEALALVKGPDAAEIHCNLAVVLALTGKTEEAVAHLRQALELTPADYVSRNNLAALLVRLGRPDEAIAQWSEALRIKPDYTDARRNLARGLMLQGRMDQAAAELREVLRRNPDDSQAQAWLNEVLARTKDAATK